MVPLVAFTASGGSLEDCCSQLIKLTKLVAILWKINFTLVRWLTLRPDHDDNQLLLSRAYLFPIPAFTVYTVFDDNILILVGTVLKLVQIILDQPEHKSRQIWHEVPQGSILGYSYSVFLWSHYFRTLSITSSNTTCILMISSVFQS